MHLPEKKRLEVSNRSDLTESVPQSQHSPRVQQNRLPKNTGFQPTNPRLKGPEVPPAMKRNEHSSTTEHPIRITPEKQKRAAQLYQAYLAAGDTYPMSSQSSNPVAIAFNGETGRRRTRRILSPKSKAKAALVRHLGACWQCRARRVPVRLFLEDIG